MGVRQRKNHLILALKGYAFGGKLSQEQVAKFELRYRQARTGQEQDTVTADLHKTLTGWVTGTDAYSRLRQAANDMDFLCDADEPDSPALREALARSQITFLKPRR